MFDSPPHIKLSRRYGPGMGKIQFEMSFETEKEDREDKGNRSPNQSDSKHSKTKKLLVSVDQSLLCVHYCV